MVDATTQVIVEMRAPRGLAAQAMSAMASQEVQVPSFQLDTAYTPVPVPPRPDMVAGLALAGEEAMLVRGTVDMAQWEALEREPRVIAVWTDARVEPFEVGAPPPPNLALRPEAAVSPCSPYDCDASPAGAKGDLAAVARYIAADQVWARGYRGRGIAIGICDTGVRRSAVPALIDGWSPPGGTPWGDDGAHYHGTMCAIDALGVCPDARILDIGILKSQAPGQPGDPTAGLLSDAIAAYDWVLARYRRDGTPQILSNSWGIYQENWGPDYARNPHYPFTRKVVEVINAGILVAFAAGNCGQVCPSGRCGGDTGPGRSIWGANGHPLVITVGAANTMGEWIGYTSQGPAALDPNKPDVCAPSHFRGYTANDNGTSAACPVAAGVLGLLRNAKPSIRQGEAKDHLQATARDICAPGRDAQSGYGIIRADAAVTRAIEPRTFPICGVQWRGTVPANGTVRWFTFNWPAYWHMVWTVVPTTPRPGGPQIQWQTQIERASGDRITYWISVTNLTPSPVDIEGRYCVLGI